MKLLGGKTQYEIRLINNSILSEKAINLVGESRNYFSIYYWFNIFDYIFHNSLE